MQFDRSKRPSSSGRINFTTPGVHKSNLSNGLKIFFSEKNDLPIVRINFLVNSGSRFDNENKGLSNLLTMCIDEGAGKFDALQLADEFELLGANFGVSCNNDTSIISLQVLSENFPAALKLIGDVIMTPHFTEEDFNREKHKVLVKLNQVKAEPDYIADVSFEHFLFGKESQYSFPIIGIGETVQNIQNDSIKNMYKKKFVPQNSSMVVVGNITQDLLQNELNQVLGEWKGSSTTEDQINIKRKSNRKIFIINKPDAVQTEIRTGHLSSKRDESDFFHKQIINMILGGQFSSRLNLNLREKNGYTYGVHSRFNYLKEAGYFAVSTSVDLINTANALGEIYFEIEKIKKGISQDELTFAQSSLTKKYPSNFETFRQIAANISAKIIHNLSDDYFKKYIDNVNSLKLNDVNSIAASSINSDQLISVLVGDASKISKQINGNEFGEVTFLDFDDVFKN
jgi:zinc protease